MKPFSLQCVFTVPYYSECNSNRDSVLSYTSVRSNSSYLGSDEMGSGNGWVFSLLAVNIVELSLQ